MSFMGASAQGLEGATDVILYGARLKRKPMMINGMESRNVPRGPAISAEGKRGEDMRARTMEEGDKKIERMGQLSYDPVQQLSVRRTSR